jgi:hypothetical protein
VKNLMIVVAAVVMGVVGFRYMGSTPAETEMNPAQASSVMAAEAALQEAGVIQVWKAPTCGCCSQWIEHLEEAGYQVEFHDEMDMTAVKAQYGIPGELQSCHTALIDGYIVEGHVPAEDIERLLTERPQITGLAVPGMPIGSPGMEMGDRVDPYDVMTFDGNGTTTVFSSYGR